jgi:O-antigen/teichoic acid export membrane protein
MKELTFGMLLAVFEEMFGAGLFWLLVVAAAVLVGIFVWMIMRDRQGFSIRFLRAELSAPIGALAAILFVQYITNSGFSDIGGPIDLIVILMIAVGGAVASTILLYVVLTALGSAPKDPHPSKPS